MGSFLDHIGTNTQPKGTSEFIQMSLSKIRELHGGFKCVCDNFSMNLTEFEQIFNGANESSFRIWDTDNNGLIDALELFCGLILFSDSKVEDKIRFLFDLFDFNEIGSISLMDLEFLIQCSLLSSCKMYSIAEDIPQTELSDLVSNSFPQGKRIDINQLLKWVAHTDETKQFCKYFGITGIDQLTQKGLTAQEYQDLKEITDLFTKNEKHKFIWQSPSQYFYLKRSRHFRRWINLVLVPVLFNRIDNPLNDEIKEVGEVKVNLEWAYGFRCVDTKNPIQYGVGWRSAYSSGKKIWGKRGAKNNEEFIYFTAAIVILFNPKLSHQRFYLEHNQEVLSVAVSNQDGGIIASGEIGDIPAIHIWNSDTLDNINVLAGIHKNGVHLLCFTQHDKYLVTCGIPAPSPIIIYDWKLGQVVGSTKVEMLIEDIFNLTSDPTENFENGANENEDLEMLKNKEWQVLISSTQILILHIFNGRSFVNYLNQNQGASNFTCGIGLVIDENNIFFKSSQNNKKPSKDDNRLIVTGHQNGAVCVWKMDKFGGELINYKTPISAIKKMIDGVAIATLSGELFIWDNVLAQCIKTIELASLPFKTLSNSICSLNYNNKKFLIATQGGDVIELHISLKKPNIKARRYNNIIKLNGNLHAMTILNQLDPCAIVGGGSSLVCSYDLTTHELIDVWNVGQSVSALSCISMEEGGFIIAAGTTDGKVLLRHDWEESFKKQYCGEKTIHHVQISKSGLFIGVASGDQFVYILQYHEEQYILFGKRKLQKGFPVSLVFAADASKVLICTSKRSLVIMDPQTMEINFTAEDVANSYWDNWIGRYPLHTKNSTASLLSACLGNKYNIISAGDEFGNIYLWKDIGEINENEADKKHSLISGNFYGHCSKVERLQFTNDDSILVSLGGEDTTLLQWNIQIIKPSETGKLMGEAIDEDNPNLPKIENQTLLNELSFSEDINIAPERIQDYSLLVRASKSPLLNTILSQSLSQASYDLSIIKIPPPCTLTMEYVYGIHTSCKRNSILYLHNYDGQKEKPKIQEWAEEELGLFGGLILPKHIENMITASIKQANKGYHNFHQSCQRFICYFVGRIAVVYNPNNNRQNIYNYHKHKISVITKHPNEFIIATGEGKDKGQILVWSGKTLRTKAILKTTHPVGIHLLAFSPDGKFLLSLGASLCSLQLFNWKQERELAFRHFGPNPIFQIKFNPFDSKEFIEAGYHHVGVWKIKGKHLTNSVYIQLKKGNERQTESPILLCFDFVNYHMGNSIESEIIFGSSKGDISVYTSGNYFPIKEKAHSAAINTLIVSDIILSPFTLITGGEDGFLKIWDNSMECIYSFDMRNLSFLQELLNNSNAFGIQSLDIYCCGPNKQKNQLILGLRGGEVIEAFITVEEHILQGGKSKTLKLDYLSMMRSHSSLRSHPNLKKVHIAAHPTESFLISVGDDQTLRLWDFNKHYSKKVKNLGKEATCVAFSPDGNYMAIGFIHGAMMILQYPARVGGTGEGLNEIDSMKFCITISLVEEIMTKVESKGSILAIKFSRKGDLLAVSYDNEIKAKKNEKGERIYEKEENSFVAIYAHHLSSRCQGMKTKDLYIKIFEIMMPYTQFEKSNINHEKNDCAITYMDFSEDSNLLQMYSQKVSLDGIPLYKNEGLFVVWDLNTNSIVLDYNILNKIKWHKWSFGNCIYSRYYNQKFQYKNAEENLQFYNKELCTLASAYAFNHNQYILAGSMNGDLHVFRYPALVLEKNQLSEFSSLNYKKEEMALARSFSAHSSIANHVEIGGDNTIAFTCGINDECIIQWRIDYEDIFCDLDYHRLIPQVADPFAEVPSSHKFKFLLNDVWLPRRDIGNISLGCDPAGYQRPPCTFEVKRILGRRAYDRRNNLKIDYLNRILFSTGSFLVYQTPSEETYPTPISQEFLSPDIFSEEDLLTSIYPEISTFALSPDKSIIAIGTAEYEAHVILWEIYTNIQLKKILIGQCCIVFNLKFNQSNPRYLIGTGVTNEYRQIIFLIDSKEKQIYASATLVHSCAFKIKDIEFIPKENSQFITVGIQHLAFWKLNGRNLEHIAGELSIPRRTKDQIGGGLFAAESDKYSGKYGMNLVCEKMAVENYELRNDQRELLHVTFMCVIFLKDAMITMGDDGYVYLWEDSEISKRVHGHEGSILCCDKVEHANILGTGGMEGSVVIWRLLIDAKSRHKSLDKLKTFSIARSSDLGKVLLDPQWNIQSLCLSLNQIIVGTRNGAIYQGHLQSANEKFFLEGDNLTIKKIYDCVDEDIPESISLDMVRKRLFWISEKGLFCVWNFETFELIYKRNYAKKTKSLYAFKLTNKLLIAFENEIMILDSNPSKNDFVMIPNYNLKFNKITDVKVSSHEKYMAVASVSQKTPQVDL